MTGTGDCRRDLGLPYAQRGGLCIGLRGIRAIDKHLICTQHIRNLRPAEAPQGDPFFALTFRTGIPPKGFIQTFRRIFIRKQHNNTLVSAKETGKPGP